MHWEYEFRCSSLILRKFTVIVWFFAYGKILEPVSEMHTFLERTVYYSNQQSETKFPAVSRRQTR